MTVDFPTFMGNTRNCNEGLIGTQGEITLKREHSLAGRDCHFSKRYQGSNHELDRTSVRQRKLGPTELYSDSLVILVILVIRKNIVQPGLICACTLIVFLQGAIRVSIELNEKRLRAEQVSL